MLGLLHYFEIDGKNIQEKQGQTKTQLNRNKRKTIQSNNRKLNQTKKTKPHKTFY